ncbi:DNA polymerase III subunit alpha [Lactiplantibacillus garii]|uniref:DNA polymerase III subunit alpha n=1 Tax=Lactiplantibacillus garii TaxID=2306423 RepID=A0A3R8KJG5_9LACO|nr:DNA polymerase III subunit alpha [Lactiplantibacillus garii]RRK11000.1 DNA polymerase III subunit alpha [Lactiplantibacillus garii]
MQYVPLQVLSTFSLLQSTSTINELVQTAKQQGYPALALTDVDVMYGIVDFYNACRQAEITPILGITLNLVGSQLTDQTFSLVVLAKDWDGYQTLMRLSTMKQTAPTDQPLTLTAVLPHLHHLIVLTPAKDSELTALLMQDAGSQVTNWVQQLQAQVDPNSLYLGVSLDQAPAMRSTVVTFADQVGLPIVALDPVDYVQPTDYFAVSVLRAIERGQQIEHPEQLRGLAGAHYLKPAATVIQDYQNVDLTAAVAATGKIASACHVELVFQQPQLPKYPTPQQQPANQYLRELCTAGLQERLAAMAPGTDAQPYQQRLERELKVIDQMGFDDYFLIVWDVMNFAHQADIMTGPGRGSAAGSLVAYVLKITDVDPLKYHLLFERFLNAKRANMPDIDLDIPDNRREQVLAYVHDKYGHDRVAQIITFGTLAAKQALRDVGRVFGLSTFEMSDWSAAIPNQLHITLKQAYAGSQRLQNMVADSSKNRLLFETAQRLEGLPRHYSTHAAGVVLSQQPLITIVPLQAGSETMMMTQYTKDTVEAVGLLKMDFLGLRNLSLMASALHYVQRQTGQPFAITKIDLNDPETLKLFQAGDTTGVFQFESAGIRNVLRKLHPDNFELVAAVNALYRPGPMENIDHFIARKRGQEPVNYPAPELAPILGPTYGILVYQEQVMQVAAVMGGFSLGEADLLRRAMSKKKRAVIDEMRQKFIAGAEANGFAPDVAVQVYQYIEQFANYGFNRSHAVAYSKMAFELAYLKVHFPGAFFTSLMNSVLGNGTKLKQYLAEAKQHHVAIVAPDINRSGQFFDWNGQQLIFGLSSIKGLRRDFIQSVISERQANGPFKNLQQFMQRVDPKWLKDDLMTALIYAGAFDHFGLNRAELLTSVPELMSSAELAGNSMSLFASLAPKIKKQPELPLAERLAKEAEYLGTYVSGHPVETYQWLAQQQRTRLISTLTNEQRVKLLVYITKVRTIRTKRGQPMAFATGSDLSGEIDLTIFPTTYQRLQAQLQPESIVLITGKVEQQRGLQVIVDNWQLADQFPKPAGQLFLRLQPEQAGAEIQRKILALLRRYPGPNPVLIYSASAHRTVELNSQYWVAENDDLFGALTTLLGRDNVVMKNVTP